MFHRRTVERVCAWGSALVPAWWAAAHLGVLPSDVADVDLLRTVGLVDGGQTRILAALVAAPFAFVPLGSGLSRASLASIAVTALVGRLLYAFARGLVETRESRTTRLAAPACALATSTVMLSPLWQDAATRPVGANLTALLALAVPLAARTSSWRLTLAVLLPALAIDPGAAILGLTSATLLLATRRSARASTQRPPRSLLDAAKGGVRAHAIAAALALAFLALGPALHLLDRSALHPLAPPARALFPLVNPLPAVVAAVGPVALLLAAVGLVLLLVAPRSRAPGGLTLALLLVALAELAATSGDTARGALLLVVALVGAAMAPALHLGVELLRWARDGRGLVRALLLLLAETTLAVSSAADAAAAMDARVPEDGSWSTFATERLPPGAVVLVADRALYAHLRAAELAGEGRPDVTFVPLFDLQSREGALAWESNPRLLPLFRDFALLGAPAEATLSALASTVPLFVENGLPTPPTLTIHQVPAGVFDRFFPESRGASDRLRALEREQLPPPDAALGAEGRDLLVTALRRRAFTYGALGEREVAQRALADLQTFAPAASPN
jgi:hypothetical protein